MIITDTNSNIMPKDAKELGIETVTMPFTIDDVEYMDGVDLTNEEFFQKMQAGADVKTSQPSQYFLEEMWERILKDYEEIVYIPTSSGLSGTCENAKVYAEKYNGRVHVVDNKRISVFLKESVHHAIALKNQGKSASEIKEILEATSHIQSTYLVVNQLKYLKKGGRISPAVAALGAMLNIKPILYTRGENFDKYGMALSMAQAKKKMIEKIRYDLENEFKEEYENGHMTVSIAHANCLKDALRFKEEVEKALPKLKFRFVDDMSLSVACHVGPGALALSVSFNDSL